MCNRFFFVADLYYQLRSIVMINCGGMVDTSLYIDPPPNVTMYIIDSHRPLNLDNLFSGTQVAVLDDNEDEDYVKELLDAYENVVVSEIRVLGSYHFTRQLTKVPQYGSSDDEDSDTSSNESDNEGNDDDTDNGEERTRLESDRPHQRRRLNNEEVTIFTWLSYNLLGRKVPN